MTFDPAAEILARRYAAAPGPIFRRILAALEAAVRAGDLKPGDRLPAQRALAARLGVDFTTVTRAYAAAREQNLIEGAVGRGTFVRAQALEDERAVVDLSMIIPPQPQGLALNALLADTLAEVLARSDPATLMAYRSAPGTLQERLAGARWLASAMGGTLAPERVLVCAGAQAAICAVLGLLTPPGGALAVDPLTYPGLIGAARQQHIRLIPVAGDGEGLSPDALEAACRAQPIAAVYCTPALHNPTTATMGEQRRRDLAAVIDRCGLGLIDDDAYGRLAIRPLPALSSLVRGRAFHIATLAKALTPGLRTAFVAAPDAAAALQLGERLRHVSMMAAPLMTAVASAWIRDGTAEAVLAGVRAEAAERMTLARRILPGARGGPDGLHLWLELPPGWTGPRFAAAAAARGFTVAAAEDFAVRGSVQGVRVALGAAPGPRALTAGLEAVADLLSCPPGG